MKPAHAKNCARTGRLRGAHALPRLLCIAAVLWGFTNSRAAALEKQHEVRPGQTLSGIADKYGVTKWSVAGLNGIDPETQIKVGEVLLIPPHNVVYINPGQTLWSVSRRHHMTVDDLAKLNKLKPTTTLHPGQRLVLPGYKRGKADRNWGKPRRRGRVDLYRIAHRERLTVTLVDSRGRVRGPAVHQMARFMRPRGSNKTKSPSRRLLSILAQVSDHFGGRSITVISGYRNAGGYTGAASRHVAGAALDIRIKGVPNTVLRDYCRSLTRTGCGYYPNSSFVHVDSRPSSAYWVDVSSAGQRPEYVDPADFKRGKMRAKTIDGDKEDGVQDDADELDAPSPAADTEKPKASPKPKPKAAPAPTPALGGPSADPAE